MKLNVIYVSIYSRKEQKKRKYKESDKYIILLVRFRSLTCSPSGKPKNRTQHKWRDWFNSVNSTYCYIFLIFMPKLSPKKHFLVNLRMRCCTSSAALKRIFIGSLCCSSVCLSVCMSRLLFSRLHGGKISRFKFQGAQKKILFMPQLQ